MKKSYKTIAAALLALTIIGGTLPFDGGNALFGATLTASAEGEETGSGSDSKDDDENAIKGNTFKLSNGTLTLFGNVDRN